jgi:hypothetical protein
MKKTDFILVSGKLGSLLLLDVRDTASGLHPTNQTSDTCIHPASLANPYAGNQTPLNILLSSSNIVYSRDFMTY